LAAPDLKDMLLSPMGIGIGVGALLVLGALVFFMFRGKKKPAAAEQPGLAMTQPPAAAPTAETVREEMAAAAQKIIVSADPRKEQLSQIARDYHDAAVRIIRMWLQEEAGKTRAAGGNSANA
jgi:flagellar biosynthesis/type III secretory pathway M-ring protein FliF/YscJ